MRPVRTARSNLVYVGPTPDIGDLHCQRLEIGRVRSIWHLSQAERQAVAAGADIALDVLQEPHPPVALSVVDEPGVGEDDPAILDRLDQLREGAP